MDTPTYTVKHNFSDPTTEQIFNNKGATGNGVEFPSRIYSQTSFDILLQGYKWDSYETKVEENFILNDFTDAKAYIKPADSIIAATEIASGATTANTNEILFSVAEDIIPSSFAQYTSPANPTPIVIYIVVTNGAGKKISLETNVAVMDITRNGTEDNTALEASGISLSVDQSAKWTAKFNEVPITVERAIDLLGGTSVTDQGVVIDALAVQPGSPSDGDRYLATATAGDWTINHIHEWNTTQGAWLDYTPKEGDELYDDTANIRKRYDGSSWNAITVDDGSITTAKIADGSITQAKLDAGFTLPADNVTNTELADMAQDTIKGRFSAGTGDPEDLTTGSVRTMLAISNVDNTSDVDKPISTAVQSALNNKLGVNDKAADTLRLNTFPVSNDNISNGRVLAFNAALTQLEYVDQAAGGGGAGVTYPFIFSTDITATDPTSGGVKYNSATVASVTQIYISATANNNVDATTLLNSLGSGDSFYIQQSDTDSKHILVDITGVTDNTGWFTLDVTVASAGTLIDNAAAAGTIFNYVSGGAGSGVTSAFGRTGAVAAAASDYDASQVDNDSTVTGAFVSDALDTLETSKMDEATYDAAGIAEQVVGLTAIQSMTNKTVNGVNLVSNGGASQVLYDDGIYRTPPGASGGEANTASNTGLGDAGLFKQKSGVDLEFKDIVGGTNCTITSQADTVTINATGESNAAANLAGDEGLFAQKNGIDLEFKALTAGTNVTLSSDANAVTINATGESNTSSNTGAGAQLAKTKSGSDLPFRTLTSSDSTITITQNTDTVDLTGGGYPRGKVTGLATTGTVDIDWSLGDHFVIGTMTGNMTLTFSNVTQGQPISIDITGASGYTLTMPASVDIALEGTTFTADVRNLIHLKAVDSATSQEVVYSVLTASAGGGTANSEDINQTAHGLAKLDVVRYDGTDYIKAQADSLTNADAIGIVSDVADVDNFTVTYGGIVDWDVPASPDFTLGSDLWLSPSTAGLIVDVEPTYNEGEVRLYLGTAVASGVMTNIDLGEEVAAIAGGGGGILPSANATKTGNYTIVAGDIGNRIILGSGASADSTFTLDVSLLADDTEQISFVNKSAYRLEVVVSNTGTMTINDVATNRYLFKGDGVLTLNGDSSTNCDIVAG